MLVEVENADLELLTTLMNKGLIRGEDVDAETLQETADEQPAVEIAKYYYVARKLCLHQNGRWKFYTIKEKSTLPVKADRVGFFNLF